MPEIKVVTEVAGRVCALPSKSTAIICNGDEIAFVEAMKMEIPVTSTTAGKIKTITVRIDDIPSSPKAGQSRSWRTLRRRVPPSRAD